MLLGALVRIISVVFVIGASIFSKSPAVLFSFMASLAFAHLILSVVYSKKQIIGIKRDARSAFLLVAGVPFSMALYFYSFSMGLYFGMHHVFNEVYTVKNPADVGTGSVLRFWRLIMGSFVVLTCLRNYEAVESIDSRIIFGGLFVSTVIYFALLFLRAPYMTLRNLFGAAAFECLGLAMVVLSLFTSITIIHIALYHFTFWSIYPVIGLMKKSAVSAGKFVAANSILTLLFWTVSPFGSAPIHFELWQWITAFQFFTFIHITSALSLSAAHPRWIRTIFQPHEPIIQGGQLGLAEGRRELAALSS